MYTKDVRAMANLRTYRELLFPIRLKQEAEQAEVLADEVWQSGIGDFLKECHKQGTPFRFRVEIRADMENDKRASFAKKFAIQLERVSARWLINSTGDYETEIRLIKKKDGSFAPFLKLYTIPMRRFSYRKNVVAASIHPSLAAMLVSLAKPYLKENAQILDPFCGVGTMLIERDIAQPAEKSTESIFLDRQSKAQGRTLLWQGKRSILSIEIILILNTIICLMRLLPICRCGGNSHEVRWTHCMLLFLKSRKKF